MYYDVFKFSYTVEKTKSGRKMMKKVFKSIIAIVSVLTLFVIANNTKADAAYGKVGDFTVPKVYRGTWYTYDKDAGFTFIKNRKSKNSLIKVTFTAHTMNGKHIYIQDGHEAYKYFGHPNSKQQKKLEKATKDWYAGSYSKLQGRKFLRIDPWQTFESWNNFTPMTEVVNGKKQTVLWYTNFYSQYVNLYKSKKLAKQMQDHKFPKEDRLRKGNI